MGRRAALRDGGAGNGSRGRDIGARSAVTPSRGPGSGAGRAARAVTKRETRISGAGLVRAPGGASGGTHRLARRFPPLPPCEAGGGSGLCSCPAGGARGDSPRGTSRPEYASALLAPRRDTVPFADIPLSARLDDVRAVVRLRALLPPPGRPPRGRAEVTGCWGGPARAVPCPTSRGEGAGARGGGAPREGRGRRSARGARIAGAGGPWSHGGTGAPPPPARGGDRGRRGPRPGGGLRAQFNGAIARIRAPPPRRAASRAGGRKRTAPGRVGRRTPGEPRGAGRRSGGSSMASPGGGAGVSAGSASGPPPSALGPPGTRPLRTPCGQCRAWTRGRRSSPRGAARGPRGAPPRPSRR